MLLFNTYLIQDNNFRITFVTYLTHFAPFATICDYFTLIDTMSEYDP